MDYIVVLILGLSLGSFGSVILYRLQGDITWSVIKSVLVGRSYCIKCKHTLKWYNLIPFLSYIRQKGVCSYCKESISINYLIIEIMSAVVVVTTYYISHDIAHLGLLSVTIWIIINWLLFIISLNDIERLELHIPSWILIMLVTILFIVMGGYYYDSIVGIVIWGGCYTLIYALAKLYAKYKYNMEEGLGEGDVWMSLIFGALLPYVFFYNNIGFTRGNVLQMLLIFVILSSLVGVIMSLVLSNTNKEGKNIIAFIPAMVVAFWIILLFGDKLFTLVFAI